MTAKRLHTEEGWDWGDFPCQQEGRLRPNLAPSSLNSYPLSRVKTWLLILLRLWVFTTSLCHFLWPREVYTKVSKWRNRCSRYETRKSIENKLFRKTKRWDSNCHHLERSTESICCSLNWCISGKAILKFRVEGHEERPKKSERWVDHTVITSDWLFAVLLPRECYHCITLDQITCGTVAF